MADKKIDKKFCGICGKKAGLISKQVMADGVICEKCLLATGLKPQMKHYMELQDVPIAGLVHYVQLQLGTLDEIEAFQGNDAVADIAFFDDHERKFIVRDGLRSKDKAEDYTLIYYDKLLGFEIEEDGLVLARDTIQSEPMGELEFGPEGARIGGEIVQRKLKSACITLKVNLVIDDPFCKTLSINLVGVKTKRDTDLYRNSIRLAYDMGYKMSGIMHGQIRQLIQEEVGVEAEE